MIVGCGGDAPAESASLLSVRYYTDSGSLPPEHHFERVVTVEGSTMSVEFTREYGDVVEVDETVQLSAEQVAELEDVIRSSDISVSQKDSDGCDGASTSSLLLMWSDGTELRGEIETCDSTSVLGGDYEAVMAHLTELAVLAEP